ncbi:MAG: 50S ribosomal protein L14 [Candidatus Thermoplasmatota archaeon]|nr:50S ribosomal protein L14 [Candidatus Thermoplasmatota archaeon]MBS3789864.1 50S ribosomal protein L14 [Candidatus Thermoplasmatota archaeon]
MKGVAGNQTKGLSVGSELECIDNTGAKVVRVVSVINYHGVHRRYPKAGIGDQVVASVVKGTPEMKRELTRAVIVRQKRPFRRADGVMVEFEDNAVVLTQEDGETKGSEIKGPVAREAAEKWPRVGATASMIM